MCRQLGYLLVLVRAKYHWSDEPEWQELRLTSRIAHILDPSSTPDSPDSSGMFDLVASPFVQDTASTVDSTVIGQTSIRVSLCVYQSGDRHHSSPVQTHLKFDLPTCRQLVHSRYG